MSTDRQQSQSEVLLKSLLDVAVESWRFSKLFDRLLMKLDAGERGRYQGQFKWFVRQLEEALVDAGVRIVNLEGSSFDPGMAATPLNIDDFAPNEPLVVDQMIEPVIMGSNGVIRTGTVTLRKACE